MLSNLFFLSLFKTSYKSPFMDYERPSKGCANYNSVNCCLSVYCLLSYR